MRIGIDARFFGPKGKGLGRYTQKLIENLEKIDNQNQYVIFLRQENWELYQPSTPNFKKVSADYRWYSLAEQIFMPFKIYQQKVDLMHFPHFNVPIFYFGPFIVTIHDLILRRFQTRRASTLGPIKYWLKSLAYRIVIWFAIHRAKKIIAVSNYTKNDILNFFKISPGKLEVIYEGAPSHRVIASESRQWRDERGNPIQSQLSTGLLRRRFAPPRNDLLLKYRITKPYLLYVGNAYPHKNLERLIEAFKILLEKYKQDLQLVLVGEEDYFYHRLKSKNSLILESIKEMCGVVFTGFVPDEELAALYQNAALYVFPSLCEGFGLSPLEAMTHGVPVVSSDSTCLPETLDEAAIYFDATNPQDMSEKIKQVLEDENLRQNLIAKGYEQIKKYSWQKMAEETLGIYLDYK